MQEAPRRLGRLDVLLVRHAEPIPPWSPGWEERDDERPLTDEGRLAAEQLADELEPYVITSVYSSPYHAGSRDRDPDGKPPHAGGAAAAGPARAAPDAGADGRLGGPPAALLGRSGLRPRGRRVGRQAQRRAIAQLDLLRARHADGGRLLVGSHGNLISLILQAFEPAVDHDFHMAMPTPAIYHLEHDGIGWRVMGGHGFVEAAPQN